MSLSTPDAVSVLIPTYRRPHLLRRAISSVLEQEYPHVRACVFDNASGDATAEVVAEMQARDPRVRYHCHETNLGAAANFQHALASVETPFFSILSDDDFLLPRFCAAAIQGFGRHPDAMMACFDVLQMNPRGDVVRETSLAGCPEGRYGCPEGLLAMVTHGSTTITGIVFRQRVLAEISRFDEAAGAASDVDFVLRTAARHPFVLSHTAGAVFAPVSIADVRSLRSTLAAFWPGWMRMVENVAGTDSLSPDVAGEVRERLVATLARHLSYVGAAALVRGDFEEALKTAVVLGGPLRRTGPARALDLLARACRAVPGVHALARWAFWVRGALRHHWRRFRGAILRHDPEARRVERLHRVDGGRGVL